MKRNAFLLHAFGKDRPGIVAGVSKVLLDLGGNLEDSAMTRLGGEFAMMLLASFPSRCTAEHLRAALKRHNSGGRLHFDVQLVPSSRNKKHRPSGGRHLVSVYGADRPGIVYHITQTLARRRVNITDLTTEVSASPAHPNYLLLIEVDLPRGLAPSKLRRALEQVGRRLRVYVTLRPCDPVSL